MSYLSWPVSQIALQIPGATAILFKKKINFCCDGQKRLGDVLAHKNLDGDAFVKDLEQLERQSQAQPLDYVAMDTIELIRHILVRYHEVHREQLKELIRLAERVETVHSQHPLCPRGLAAHLLKMQRELLDHMDKEERILFPMLTGTMHPMAAGPIRVMMEDHEQHRAEIEKIYALTQDVTPHSEACNTWRALYLGLQEFIRDLNLHIHLENEVLFPRAKHD